MSALTATVMNDSQVVATSEVKNRMGRGLLWKGPEGLWKGMQLVC